MYFRLSYSLTYVTVFHHCKISNIVFVSLMFVNTVLMTLFEHRNRTMFVY